MWELDLLEEFDSDPFDFPIHHIVIVDSLSGIWRLTTPGPAPGLLTNREYRARSKDTSTSSTPRT